MNTVRKAIDEFEDICLFQENRYTDSVRPDLLAEFQKLVDSGRIRGSFTDTAWVAFNGLKSCTIRFELDELGYQKHMRDAIGLTAGTVIDRLKCYAINVSGSFIFLTIARKVEEILRFLSSFPFAGGGASYKVTASERCAVSDFLGFLSIPEETVRGILERMDLIKTKASGQRDLAHLVNYLAIANEIGQMYEEGKEEGLTDEEYCHWYPVYFWTKVTFILPLRATEMLVTPFECLSEEDGAFYLTVRRTALKGGNHRVFHSVDQDYDLYSYRIPETRFIDVTRRYQKLSAGDQRRFLFYPGSSSKWGVFSLDRMNTLLEEFTLEKLACSPSYDYTLYASGLKNFTPVTAGDSRPIAAANLLYQNVSIDVIRQLLVHVSPKTCFHYYSNVADTVLASSIIAAQRELNKRRQYFDQEVKQTAMEIFTEGRTGCRSSRRPLETGDIADCEKYGHLEDCFGCPLYLPAEEELSLMLDKRREELNSVTRTLFGYLAGMSGMKRIDADKTLLEAQTGLARFMEACQQEQKEGIKKWQRHNPTQTSCC